MITFMEKPEVDSTKFGLGLAELLKELKETLAELPPEDQKIFNEVWAKAYVISSEGSYETIPKGIKSATDAGRTIQSLKMSPRSGATFLVNVPWGNDLLILAIRPSAR